MQHSFKGKPPRSYPVRSLIPGVVMALLAVSSPAALALTQVSGFGSNPGALTMHKHVPANMPANAALVVALHGCGQNAVDYEKTGWSALADAHKFYVVYPQQQVANHASTCFNWFEPGDNARGQGEALSIKQMVDKMQADHAIDPARVFITGLSGGAAFTNVMLAAYPDVFAAGAPIAGVPYKCATTLSAAINCMNSGVDKTPLAWGDLARSGYSGYAGRKPRVSIWQGSADTNVKAMNMDETMQQWTNYHGIDQVDDASELVKGFPRKIYKDANGNALVETVSLTNMGHGAPVDPGSAVDQCGATGSYLLDMNICSSYYIGQFFGIVGSSPLPTTTTTSTTTTTTISISCYTSSNFSHVYNKRAWSNGGYTYANGSNQYMGLYNTYTTRTLKKTSPNYFVIGTC